MRITVHDVLSYFAAGMTPEQILADFPYLEKRGLLRLFGVRGVKTTRCSHADETALRSNSLRHW
jgi:Protein of unknown function (DUF433)